MKAKNYLCKPIFLFLEEKENEKNVNILEWKMMANQQKQLGGKTILDYTNNIPILINIILFS